MSEPIKPEEPQAPEPFVPAEDRPEVKLNPDTPISELRVRDLHSILGGMTPKKLEKLEVKEIKLEIKDKVEKLEKHEKLEIKDKVEKLEKHEIKDHKSEKFEKPELKNEFKEHKHEKLETKDKIEKLEHPEKLVLDKVEPDKQIVESGPDPTRGGDPAVLNQLIERITTLQSRVDQLTSQINEMQKRSK